MQNHGAQTLPLPDRNHDGPDHHRPILPVMHRLADDELAEQVEHHAQVQLAFAGSELGDVGDPPGIGLQRGEVTLEAVDDARYGRAPLSPNTTSLLSGSAQKPVRCHQPRSPVQAGILAIIRQVFLHTRRTDCSSAVLVQFTNADKQTLAIHGPSARRALLPRVIAAGRHPQAPILQTNRKVTAATPDRLILQYDSLVENVAASHKKFRSFFIRASSRLSLANASSRAVPVPMNAAA